VNPSQRPRPIRAGTQPRGKLIEEVAHPGGHDVVDGDPIDARGSAVGTDLAPIPPQHVAAGDLVIEGVEAAVPILLGDASDIFSVLTTTPEYKGLRINPNYGLETLGPDGEPVPGRSAGQEQIVAFALIGALNRNATRRAPVIMDTPLARLDRGHRAKVLSFLGDMAQQVFLLVHSAEVSEEDLAAIRGTIAREFELHPDALFRTQIRERTLA
jgi:hypothetical protein